MKITNHKLCQFIVKKYVTQKVDWPREIKIAQKLIKTYKGYSFWNGLKPANLPSLAFFLTEEGKKFLLSYYEDEYDDDVHCGGWKNYNNEDA